VPAGRGDPVVIASAGGLMVIENAFVAVRDSLSVTRTVKFSGPAVEGVPVIDPDGDSVSPVGNSPDVTDQV
jgi:hypothetical protein